MRLRVTTVFFLSAFLFLACSGDSSGPSGPALDTPELSLSAQLADLELLISAAGEENFEWTGELEPIIDRVHQRFDAGLGTIKSENDDGLSRTLQGSRSLSQAAILVVPDVFPSPGAAVGAAAPGDVVIVKGGEYPELVGIGQNNLTLIGLGATVIGAIEVLGASGVTVAGFNVQVGIPEDPHQGLSFLDSPNGRAVGNTVTGVGTFPANPFFWVGISCGRSTNCRVMGNRVSDNFIGLAVGSFGDGAANGFVYGNRVRRHNVGVAVGTGADPFGVFSPNQGTDIAFNWIEESLFFGVDIGFFPPEPPAEPPDGTLIRFNRFRCNATDINDNGTNTVIGYNSFGC